MPYHRKPGVTNICFTNIFAFFFFFLLVWIRYIPYACQNTKKKCSTKHQNHATKAKQQNLLAWAVHLLLHGKSDHETETRVNKWTKWKNSALLMKHTHTHFAVCTQNADIGRKPCTQGHNSKSTQPTVQILYVGFNFGTWCAFGVVSVSNLFRQVCSIATVTKTIHLSFTSLKD